MAQANIERDRLYDREEARVEERELQLHAMLVDVLVVGGDVSPLFVEQEEEIEPPGGILHVELGEFLADAQHRHGEQLAREAMVEQAPRDAHSLLGEAGPDGLVPGPPAQPTAGPRR